MSIQLHRRCVYRTAATAVVCALFFTFGTPTVHGAPVHVRPPAACDPVNDIDCGWTPPPWR